MRASQEDSVPIIASILHPSDFSAASEVAFAHALKAALIAKSQLVERHRAVGRRHRRHCADGQRHGYGADSLAAVRRSKPARRRLARRPCSAERRERSPRLDSSLGIE
jgi:hypothetical protein